MITKMDDDMPEVGPPCKTINATSEFDDNEEIPNDNDDIPLDNINCFAIIEPIEAFFQDEELRIVEMRTVELTSKSPRLTCLKLGEAILL
jgi:hypothetical protein